MAKNPFGNPFRPARQPAPFGGRPAKVGRPAVVKPEKPKNHMQAGSNLTAAQEALARGVCLSFSYDGLPRVVEVHTVGFTRADRAAMNVWQVDGASEDGPIPDWRTFCFDECFDVRLTDMASEAPRQGFRRGAKQFARILVEV